MTPKDFDSIMTYFLLHSYFFVCVCEVVLYTDQIIIQMYLCSIKSALDFFFIK